jgi:hypothetical protein
MPSARCLAIVGTAFLQFSVHFIHCKRAIVLKALIIAELRGLILFVRGAMSSSIKLPHFLCCRGRCPGLRAQQCESLPESIRWHWQQKLQEASCEIVSHFGRQSGHQTHHNNEQQSYAWRVFGQIGFMPRVLAVGAYEAARERPDRPSGAVGAVGDRMPAGCCCKLLANICKRLRFRD